jgi:hypothetical protein
MADEINALLYQTIKNYGPFVTKTGATVTDPRVYKRKAPIKLTISDDKSSFVVYYIMGSTDVSTPKVDFGQRNNRTYGLEIYGKAEEDVEEIADMLEELLRDKQFTTNSYKIGYTYASRGAIDFNDARQLYTETMMVHLTKIIYLTLAS